MTRQLRSPQRTLVVIRSFLALCTLSFCGSSFAYLPAPATFCNHYPGSELCVQKRVDCGLCHSTQPNLNSYGSSVYAALIESSPTYSLAEFEARLPEALGAVEGLDSDGDSSTNITEINQGSFPGDERSNSETSTSLVWNSELAYKRVGALFCGRSPNYQQMQNLAGAANKQDAVHTYLDSCLQTDFWKKKALHRLADKRIRPIEELGINGSISLADFMWDYRLFSYVMSDERDTRDLLLANYHIDEDYNVVRGVIAKQIPFAIGSEINLGTGQPLVENRRAGMVTTQWFLSMFTMFAILPRNTASQAYRAYLGLDIAKGEGLSPVVGEPRDVDNKNIAQPACAVCHSTLDPLAYAFSAYNGIEIGNTIDLISGNPLGSYRADRTDWEGDGYIFGQAVKDLNEWKQIAANSDAFKINLVTIFYQYAIGREPNASEQQDFSALWQSVESDNYSANKLIHRIVNTNAFGGQ